MDGAREVRRRPWWIWVVPFAALLGTLIARNTLLFGTRLYEQGDSGADSILIEQALRFRLLVGNYSREGFNHPGPAFMYIQALGEWLARDVLRVVPTPWNGQLLAVFALNSALAALAVGVVYGWTGSLWGAAAAFAVIGGFVAAHPDILISNWMPFMYVLPFFLFLLAAASVAAGQARDLWVLALSGWLLIHGHACFLFFVPVLTASAGLLALWPLWPLRPGRLAAARGRVREHRASVIAAAVISAVFITPMALNLILHWPGDFGKYFSYAGSSAAGGHTAAQIARYALWYWWPRGTAFALAVLVALFATSSAVALVLARGRLRRCLLCLVAMAALASLAFIIYAAVGIDFLNQVYIGYFYWSVPFTLLLVIAVGLACAYPVRSAVAVAAAAGVVIVLAFGVNVRADLHDNDPGLPGTVATLAARSHGRPIVIDPEGLAWVETSGFLVQAERTGVLACVDQPAMAYLVSTQFVCTPREESAGVRYRFLPSGPPGGTGVILRFGTPSPGYTTVTAGPEALP